MLHLTIYKLYPFEKVDFWLTVKMYMRNYVKLDHIQIMYQWFSISLHFHKTDSEVKMRVYLSAYSITTSARSKPKSTRAWHEWIRINMSWTRANMSLKQVYITKNRINMAKKMTASFESRLPENNISFFLSSNARDLAKLTPSS